MDQDALAAALITLLKDRANLSVTTDYTYESFTGKNLRVRVELTIDDETVLKAYDYVMVPED